MTAHTKGSGLKWVGRAIRRVEDPALLTGQGRFTADLPAAHWVRFVRSPFAAGKIAKIKAPDGAHGDHRRRPQRREANPADAAQVQLQAGRPAGVGRRRRALCRRTGRRGRGGERGRSRGHRRAGRAGDRADHAGDRRARGAGARHAADSRRSARQRHPRRQGEDRRLRRGLERRAQDRPVEARSHRQNATPMEARGGARRLRCRHRSRHADLHHADAASHAHRHRRRARHAGEPICA